MSSKRIWAISCACEIAKILLRSFHFHEIRRFWEQCACPFRGAHDHSLIVVFTYTVRCLCHTLNFAVYTLHSHVATVHYCSRHLSEQIQYRKQSGVWLLMLVHENSATTLLFCCFSINSILCHMYSTLLYEIAMHMLCGWFVGLCSFRVASVVWLHLGFTCSFILICTVYSVSCLFSTECFMNICFSGHVYKVLKEFLFLKTKKQKYQKKREETPLHCQIK